MKTLFTFLSLILTSGFVFGQASNECNGTRYLDPVFSTTTMTSAVKYGENTTVGGNFQELFMDIYEPDGDAAAQRPLIIWAHGGSFIGGSRGDMSGYCEAYAEKGFVTATITYRLFDGPLFPIPDSLEMMEEVVMSISDMKAAIRFFRKDAATTNTYKIDPNNIYVGGLSAGAITALHTAMIDDPAELPAHLETEMNNQGGIEGNTDDPANPALGTYTSEVKGVINYSGALNIVDFLDAGDPAVVSIHGDDDDTVPYGYGFASVFGFPIVSMNGSALIHQRAVSEGVYDKFLSIPGGSHTDFYGNAIWAAQIDDSTSQFLEYLICNVTVAAEEAIDVSANVSIAPNPASTSITIQSVDVPATAQLQLFDNLGRTVVSQQNINAAYHTVSVESLPAGVYHLQMTFDDADYAPVTKRLIVQ